MPFDRAPQSLHLGAMQSCQLEKGNRSIAPLRAQRRQCTMQPPPLNL